MYIFLKNDSNYLIWVGGGGGINSDVLGMCGTIFIMDSLNVFPQLGSTTMGREEFEQGLD